MRRWTSIVANSPSYLPRKRSGKWIFMRAAVRISDPLHATAVAVNGQVVGNGLDPQICLSPIRELTNKVI
jgi:hypothetical protein